MKYLIVFALLLPLTSLASGYYHHKPPKPVIIDKTVTEEYYIDRTVTIDNTVTEYVDNSVIREFTVDNTITQHYTTKEYYENTFDDNRLTAGIAGIGALAMLPTISKDSNKRTAVAVGAFQYVNKTAIALGITGVRQDMSYKVGATYNGDDIFGGAGMAFGF